MRRLTNARSLNNKKTKARKKKKRLSLQDDAMEGVNTDPPPVDRVSEAAPEAPSEAPSEAAPESAMEDGDPSDNGGSDSGDSGWATDDGAFNTRGLVLPAETKVS